MVDDKYSALIEATDPTLIMLVRMNQPVVFLLTLTATGGVGMGDIPNASVEGPAFAFRNEASRPAKVTATYESVGQPSYTREFSVNSENIRAVPLKLEGVLRKATFVIEPGSISDRRAAIIIFKAEPPGWES